MSKSACRLLPKFKSWALLWTGLGLVFSLSAPAANHIEIYEWHPGESLAPLILPVKPNETPTEAATRYLRELGRQPDLMELFGGHVPNLNRSEFKKLENSNLESRALLIANLPKDYGPTSLRVQKFTEIFKKAQHDSFILPINANLGLTTAETADFHSQIADRFPFLVAMGGDDVDPLLYNEDHTLTKLTVPFRDRYEANLIKNYVQKAKGFLLGVCRGSQLSAVALGYKLVQDIPTLVEKGIPHGDHWHDIRIHETPHNVLKTLADSQGRLRVNSLHHQSVRFSGTGPLALAATSEDGVTEATEFKNGKGLLLQFHPELMNNLLGERILHHIVLQKTRMVPARCDRVFVAK